MQNAIGNVNIGCYYLPEKDDHIQQRIQDSLYAYRRQPKSCVNAGTEERNNQTNHPPGGQFREVEFRAQNQPQNKGGPEEPSKPFRLFRCCVGNPRHLRIQVFIREFVSTFTKLVDILRSSTASVNAFFPNICICEYSNTVDTRKNHPRLLLYVYVGLKDESIGWHMEYHKIPDEAVRRLPFYFRGLLILREQGRKSISSRDLADSLGFGHWQIRKDLSYFGSFGTPGKGYDTEKLIRQIRKMTCPTDGGRGASLIDWAAIDSKGTFYGRQEYTIETLQ